MCMCRIVSVCGGLPSLLKEEIPKPGELRSFRVSCVRACIHQELRKKASKVSRFMRKKKRRPDNWSKSRDVSPG